MALDPSGNCAKDETPSDDGRVQSQWLTAMLDTGGVTFDAVLTGPCCRAQQTAQFDFGKAAVDQNLTALAYREELEIRPGVAASNEIEVPVAVTM